MHFSSANTQSTIIPFGYGGIKKLNIVKPLKQLPKSNGFHDKNERFWKNLFKSEIGLKTFWSKAASDQDKNDQSQELSLVLRQLVSDHSRLEKR